MEMYTPVRKAGATTWVKTRTERHQTGMAVTKKVMVENNPYGNLRLSPWAETARVSVTAGGNVAEDHVDFMFQGQRAATVEIGLDYGTVTQDLTRFDGSIEAQGRTSKLRNMTKCAVPNNNARRTYEPCIFQGGVWGR